MINYALIVLMFFCAVYANCSAIPISTVSSDTPFCRRYCWKGSPPTMLFPLTAMKIPACELNLSLSVSRTEYVIFSEVTESVLSASSAALSTAYFVLFL